MTAIGSVAMAGAADLDQALAPAERGFKVWRKVSAFERGKVIREAARLMRERAGRIAGLLSLEQGKPLGEATVEVLASADILDWFAEEGRRTYGRIVPARASNVHQLVVREPVGPVAAFTPWNFPVSQTIRKIGAALATGCSIIVKPPEETPASPACLADAFKDVRLPDGVLNLVYGDPPEISNHLIPHQVIRKVSFTGSVPIGKQLAALAGQHMKRVDHGAWRACAGDRQISCETRSASLASAAASMQRPSTSVSIDRWVGSWTASLSRHRVGIFHCPPFYRSTSGTRR